MDFGHYNCRDYYISPHFSATTIVRDRSLLERPRHESFDDLERRCRSPASLKPKFPLLKLPLELRQQIFKYLLPSTRAHTETNLLATHARNFSAVKKRGERGMFIPRPGMQRGPGHVVWQRGNINLLCVCRQLHQECAELLYGNNTFLLFVTYSGTTFRFSWLLPTGAAPSRQFKILELLPKRYLALIKRVVVNVDHVDSYTGMVKFNVSGNGLTHGLRKQVQHLVDALRPLEHVPDSEQCHRDSDALTIKLGDRRLARVFIRVTDSSASIDRVKGDTTRRREEVKVSKENEQTPELCVPLRTVREATRPSKNIEQILEPFGTLRGVREIVISGAVTDEFAGTLEQKMKSTDDTGLTAEFRLAKDLYDTPPSHLCVYGNDI